MKSKVFVNEFEGRSAIRTKRIKYRGENVKTKSEIIVNGIDLSIVGSAFNFSGNLTIKEAIELRDILVAQITEMTASITEQEPEQKPVQRKKRVQEPSEEIPLAPSISEAPTPPISPVIKKRSRRAPTKKVNI